MRLIDGFVNKVLSCDNSFILIDDDESGASRHIQFVQCVVGEAKYIYGFYGFNPEFNIRLEQKFDLIAIVANEKVYIVNEFLLNVWKKEDKRNLPLSCKFFNREIIRTNDYVKNVVFKKFYDRLEVSDVVNEDLLKHCEKEARIHVLTNGKVVKDFSVSPLFGEEGVAKILCGIIDLEEVAMQHFERERNSWINKKVTYEKINELINKPDIVKDWEFRLSGRLREVDAKSVTVEFEMNGRIETSKLKPKQIVNKLISDDYFSYYDFPTKNQGSQLLDNLGAGRSLFDDGEVLKVKHITKITYGKKLLYSKKN